MYLKTLAEMGKESFVYKTREKEGSELKLTICSNCEARIISYVLPKTIYIDCESCHHRIKLKERRG